ncbi:50S ribosomal protein L29 [Bdellovibrio sp. HCB337]|jgi:large subunit ribosomal protein L29|uniref:50S ribosomal protein L29 n=1 Tax=Bdellovibrio sp. HCB337 TaxID=3394358 RepID=UPI0039A57888
MKFTEIKDLSVVELKKKRAGLSEELFQARIKNTIGQLSNPIEIRNLRRDIAKINTAIVKKVAR